jgi:uncharacterized protein
VPGGSLAGGEKRSQGAYPGMGRLDRLPRRTLADGLIVHEATTLRARLLGLAFMGPPPLDHALLIPRCRSVHTFGMRFEIDVTFLDEHGRAIRHARRVGPRRVLFERGAFAVLERVSPPRPPGARGEGSTR